MELYIVPFGGYEKPFLYSDNFTEEQMREMDMNPDDYIKLSRNYSFTIDNASSIALLPVTKDSGEFVPKIQPAPDPDNPASGDEPSENPDGKTPDSGKTPASGAIPSTGDNSNVLLWVIILAAAALAIGVSITIIIITKKKRK